MLFQHSTVFFFCLFAEFRAKIGSFTVFFAVFLLCFSMRKLSTGSQRDGGRGNGAPGGNVPSWGIASNLGPDGTIGRGSSVPRRDTANDSGTRSGRGRSGRDGSGRGGSDGSGRGGSGRGGSDGSGRGGSGRDDAVIVMLHVGALLVTLALTGPLAAVAVSHAGALLVTVFLVMMALGDVALVVVVLVVVVMVVLVVVVLVMMALV